MSFYLKLSLRRVIKIKILSSKLLSYEEELVEYISTEEYLKDIDVRKQNGWYRDKKPNFYNESYEVITKFNNDKIIQRYKRYGAIKV